MSAGRCRTVQHAIPQNARISNTTRGRLKRCSSGTVRHTHHRLVTLLEATAGLANSLHATFFWDRFDLNSTSLPTTRAAIIKVRTGIRDRAAIALATAASTLLHNALRLLSRIRAVATCNPARATARRRFGERVQRPAFGRVRYPTRLAEAMAFPSDSRATAVRRSRLPGLAPRWKSRWSER